MSFKHLNVNTLTCWTYRWLRSLNPGLRAAGNLWLASRYMLWPLCASSFSPSVVFMGSEKYPAENGFDAFLKKHGGSDNASTDCERTIFQFDVQRKHFRDALDRWAPRVSCYLLFVGSAVSFQACEGSALAVSGRKLFGPSGPLMGGQLFTADAVR